MQKEGGSDLRRSWREAAGAGTYLTSLLLPEDGRGRVSFGLALESHAVSSCCHLVLRLGHQLGWDWQGGWGEIKEQGVRDVKRGDGEDRREESQRG